VESPKVAERHGQQVVETEHLCSALLSDAGGLAVRLLERAGADPAAVGAAAGRHLEGLPKVSGTQGQVLGRGLEALLADARKQLGEWGDSFVSVEHLLLALARDSRFGQGFLRGFGVDHAKLAAAAREVRGSQRADSQNPEGKYESLSRYARDLTEEARRGKLDPVVGRDDEIRRCVQILSRRSKNNPCLIGEPGVGKTAAVEGLAQRVVAGDVPESLQGRRVMSLDLGALIAGAKFRGEFEDRLKAVMKEVTDSAGQVVLFIDEIHTVVGAGATGDGAMDAGNLLKPMLGRGELRCIGATTLDEYRKHIEKDPALERRFQQVLVEQPSVQDTVSILRGLRERYELHHGVSIADSALVEAAVLSDRYIADRFLPDKAIDLVDESAAKLKMEATSKPQALDELDRQIVKLEMEKLSLERGRRGGAGADRATQGRLGALKAELARLKEAQAALNAQWLREKDDMRAIQDVKEEIEQVNIELLTAERDYDLNRAAELKYGSLRELQDKLRKVEEELEEHQASGTSMLREEVTPEDIAEVVARWTGIPVAKLAQSEREKILRLADEMHKRVMGQDEAVEAVADAVQRSRAGLSDPDRPIASFMFLGPTGVGKTELAKTLAEQLFDSEDSIVRIDMSEYMEKHSVSRLVGAPPGYVGYEEGGQLTEAVRRRPYAVVLFDEVEKAHADVFNVLLQVLDDGRVTDSQGRTVSFKNVVIIMTSNVGSQHVLEPGEGGPVAAKERVMEAVQKLFRPEFVNRIDEFIVFDPLSQAQIEAIVKLQVIRVAQRLEDRKIKLQLSPGAVTHLAATGYDPIYGARPVKRAVQRQLETPLSKRLLAGDFVDEDAISVDYDEVQGALTFAKKE
jgi:ATP-dependent Clp protease ATP-binding subunit ClpB